MRNPIGIAILCGAAAVLSACASRPKPQPPPPAAAMGDSYVQVAVKSATATDFYYLLATLLPNGLQTDAQKSDWLKSKPQFGPYAFENGARAVELREGSDYRFVPLCATMIAWVKEKRAGSDTPVITLECP